MSNRCEIIFLAIALCGCSTLGFPIQVTASEASITQQEQSSAPHINALAKQVTVRILTASTSGSGVIIDRQNNTYTVLTNDHVIAAEPSPQYTILTADGKTHPGRWRRFSRFEPLDLALVEFESQASYQVVTMGNSDALQSGDPVYAAGFPNYYVPRDRSYLESTYNWGTKAFLLTEGAMVMYSPKSMLRGYSLGYTNTVKDGMSGGPVLNRNGELVGINGRLKNPIQGSQVFVFVDGTQPSQALFEQMEPLSWAIPISLFRQLLLSRS